MTADELKTTTSKSKVTRGGMSLKKLPELKEITNDNSTRILLSQSIALQLKIMKSDVNISQLGFNNLLKFIELQIDYMLQILHGLANIQRRSEISFKDIELFLQGTGIKTSSLFWHYEVSEYIKDKFAPHYASLMKRSNEMEQKWHKPISDEELLSSKYSEFFFKDVDILNLVPPTNTSNAYVPKWLPEFPPDHTYRFTSLYNRPVSDEREMKRKLFQEGQLSEAALINMLDMAHRKKFPAIDESTRHQLYKESQEETLLVFGPAAKRKCRNMDSGQSQCPIQPSKGFNIEEYARSRVELARQQVQEFEIHKLQTQKNPFIRAANIYSPYGNGPRLSRKAMEREFNVLLQRSYIGVIESIPVLKRQKEQEIMQALERIKEKKELRKKELDKKHAEQGVLDLIALHDNSLLAGLNTSDSENDDQETNPTEKFSQPMTDRSSADSQVSPGAILNLTSFPFSHLQPSNTTEPLSTDSKTNISMPSLNYQELQDQKQALSINSVASPVFSLQVSDEETGSGFQESNLSST